jgi:hypothetical protein
LQSQWEFFMRERTRFATLGLGLCAAVLALGACSSSGGHSAAKTNNTSAPPTTANSAVPVTASGEGGLQVIPGSANGQSACEKAAPTPASPGEVGAGAGGSTADSKTSTLASEHGARGMVVQQSLTHTQRIDLEAQMSAARAVAQRYPTVKDAEAAGYRRSTPYVPCIGAHYTNEGLVMGFDPARPSELLYDGTTPDSKIVGLSYLVYHPDGPPPGFAGPNDHWHQHNANGGLCLRGGTVVGGEETTRQQCAALGGRKTLLTDIWMVHAWVVPGFECSWGVFSGECPELGGQTCGNAWEAPDPSNLSQCGAVINGSN